MIRVLVDGRIDGDDGIGRYTRCLTGALHAGTGSTVDLTVLGPTGTPRYSHAEGTELLETAQGCGAEVIHTLDYRVPLEPSAVPLVVTVHDVLRLVRPEFCYTDDQFAARFGIDALAKLTTVTMALRSLTPLPAGADRAPGSLHQEFYARMVALTCARAARVLVPTQTVAGQLAAALGHAPPVRISPYGVDHPTSGTADTAVFDRIRSPYLLYVGQARPHKGLDVLLEAYGCSQARRNGVRLVCAGRDFAAETAAAVQIESQSGGVAVGVVNDATLAALYRHAEALVHLAGHEGFGFTPLEALAAGTRVLASDIPVLRETLGEHAVFTDPTDARAVATAIDHLVATPDEHTARQRRRRWASRYRWDGHASDVAKLYGDILR